MDAFGNRAYGAFVTETNHAFSQTRILTPVSASDPLKDIDLSASPALLESPQRLGKPSGWWAHVPFAAWIVEATRPRVLVGLGTHHGVSYAAFCEAVLRGGLPTRCYAIDHWRGDAHAGDVGEEVYEDVRAFNEQRYAAFSELVRMDFDTAVALFEDDSIDLLHIDGFHTLEAVLHDYETWRSKLSARAVLLLHDTNVRGGGFGVHQLFADLAGRFPHFEFLHGHGLGVIGHGAELPSAVRSLCAAAHGDSTLRIRNRFAQLGVPWACLARELEQSHSLRLQLDARAAHVRDARASEAAAIGEAKSLTARLANMQRERDAALAARAQGLADSERVRMLSRELDDADRRLEDLQVERKALLSAQRQMQAHVRQSADATGRMVAGLLQRHAEIVGEPAATGRAGKRAGTVAAGARQRPRQRRLLPGLGWLRPVVLRPVIHRWRAMRDPVAQVVRRSVLFDARWYLLTYDDVATSGLEAAYHFAVFGGAEGRAPSRWFSTSDYLRQNADVARAGINALYHYEVEGRRLGRPFPLALTTAPHPAIADVQETFRRRSEIALERFLAGDARIALPVAAQPDVSIVIVLYNEAALTFTCLEALAETIDVPAEVIVVDNASTDRTQELLERVDGCQVLRQRENLHFLRGSNVGAGAARGRHLLFLNNDAMLEPGALAGACRLFDAHPKVGAVGGKIVLLDGTLQEAGCIVWRDGSCAGFGRGRDPAEPAFEFRREVDYCSGALLFVRRACFEQLGGFDKLFAPSYYEDTDLCMRLRAAGHRVVYEPQVRATHFEYGSARSPDAAIEAMEVRHKLFVRRHAAVLAASHLPRGAGELAARARPHRAGRVLVIDDRLPHPELGAGNPRACRLLHSLHEAGAFVSHYPVAFPAFDAEQAWRSFPREVEFVAAQGRPTLSEFLRNRVGYYDVVIVSRPHNMDAFIRSCRDAPEFLPTTTLVYDAEAIFVARERARQALLGAGDGTVPVGGMDEATEMRLANRAAIVLAVSEREAASFRESGCRDVRVLGHCLEAAAMGLGFEDRRDLLFVGRLEEDDSPNADSLRWFVGEVMPRLDRHIGTGYVLNVVGGCSSSLRAALESARVCFHGRVPDLAASYASARVFVAPTRFGGGIPHKVHEAACHGLPVVASDLLAIQLGWTHGEQLLHADGAQAFAQACASAYQDPVLWQRLRDRALAAVVRDCDPRHFRSTVRSLLPGAPGDADTAPARTGDPETASPRQQTVQTWSVPPAERERAEGSFWMAHPLVAARVNVKSSGHAERDGYAHLRSMLGAAGWTFPVARAASIGCGFGALERGLASLSFARRIDGYDLAEAPINEARRLATELGLDGLQYHVADLEQDDLPEANFDMVFASHSVHHFARLDRLFGSVRRSLRPGGIFHLQEYVGPDRFQWTDAQVQAINEFLRSLPEHYRRLPSGAVRAAVSRPSVADVIAIDPSEAICSSKITEVLARHFRILEYRELGGSLLQTGLSGIVQNFDPSDPRDAAHLGRFFELEDRLMAEGRIGSDFATITAVRD